MARQDSVLSWWMDIETRDRHERPSYKMHLSTHRRGVDTLPFFFFRISNHLSHGIDLELRDSVLR